MMLIKNYHLLAEMIFRKCMGCSIEGTQNHVAQKTTFFIFDRKSLVLRKDAIL